MSRLSDEELREQLQQAGHGIPAPPLPLREILRQGVRRRRIRLAARTAAALVVVGLLAGAATWLSGAPTGEPTPAGTVTARTTPRPSPQPAPDRHHAQRRPHHAQHRGQQRPHQAQHQGHHQAQHAGAACQPKDVRISPGMPPSPMTGEDAATLVVTDVAGTPCTLFGVPAVQILAADGSVLPFHYTTKPTEYVPAQHPRTVVVTPHGATAMLLVAKYRCDSGILTPAAGIRVAIGNGTSSSTLAATDIAYCKGGPHDPGQVVAASAFTAGS